MVVREHRKAKFLAQFLSAFERAFHISRVLHLLEGDGLCTGLNSRQPLLYRCTYYLKYHKFVSASEACFMRVFTQIRLKKMNSCFLLVLFPSMLQWKLLSYQTVV